VSGLDRCLDRLHAFYGLLPPPPRDPFTLFVWEALSVHATPRRRDAALTALRHARALTPDAMARAPKAKLEAAVAQAGPYLEQRLRALRAGVDRFRRSPELAETIRGPLAAARRALKGLPQMGEGGAYRMLLFAADHAVLPVDARVARVATRLGYGAADRQFSRTARSVRDAVAAELSGTPDDFRRAYLYLSHHGAATCTEADPHCAVCPLIEECGEGKRRLEADGGQRSEARGRRSGIEP
jgi:endonuclease-3